MKTRVYIDGYNLYGSDNEQIKFEMHHVYVSTLERRASGHIAGIFKMNDSIINKLATIDRGLDRIRARIQLNSRHPTV